MSGQFRTTGLALLAASLGVTAWAQNATSTWPVDPARLGLLKETSLLIGQPVKDSEGRTVGKVQDLLVDLGTCQVVAALVSSSAEHQPTPVPALSFSRVFTDYAELGVDKKLFTSAPRLPSPEPAGACDLNNLADSFRHFSQTPPKLPAPGPLVSAARLLGARLLSQSNEPLGQLKELMVDVPLGRIIYLVIAPAADATDYYVVPPVAVHLEGASGSLVLKADQAHFLAGPRFQKDFSTDLAFPQFALAVRHHYGLQAVVASSGPAAQARSDHELTEAVLTEIVHQANGLATLNLMVTTAHGRVTVSGNVRNEKQARQILAAAQRVAGAGNVEDHLEYRGRKTAQL